MNPEQSEKYSVKRAWDLKYKADEAAARYESYLKGKADEALARYNAYLTLHK